MKRTPGSRRITWSPGWRLRAVLLATTVGSVGGLAFGLSSLNRPLLNAAVFYLLGAAVAAVVAFLAIVVARLFRRPMRPHHPAAARPGAATARMSEPPEPATGFGPPPAGGHVRTQRTAARDVHMSPGAGRGPA